MIIYGGFTTQKYFFSVMLKRMNEFVFSDLINDVWYIIISTYKVIFKQLNKYLNELQIFASGLKICVVKTLFVTSI